TGSARAMRANVVPVPVKKDSTLYDTAGTGGDGKHTFNISTAAAFVIAGAGRKVAKHGNRAASSQCGSADVLSTLGISLDLTPEQVGQAIDEVGIGFLFAPKFHPAMKFVGGPRKEIGQRTIFNVLGPLTNPAGAEVQIIGVFDPELTEPMAKVLGELGSRAAFVVHGYGGMDELNTVGPNRVSHLKDGKVTTMTLEPEMLDLPRGEITDLTGGTPEDNAQILRGVLRGSLNGTRKNAVLLNAAAALSAENGDLREGFALAKQSLESGAALGKLDELVAFSSRS
ncbi:MAG TPA: anthranilate phosphoribosyltransferase, partial [Anaerolineae bacterium]|nr:anthranilate phosphoribosyltransferase [Anaerolineae bacterium]